MLVFLSVLVLIFVVIKVVLFAKNYSDLIFSLVFKHNITLNNTNGRINILLLGIGGGTHDGPNLTDTIILASLDPAKNRITLLSIPRDLWVPELKGKINTAYAIGYAQNPSSGLVLAKAVVERITGQDVNYGVRINFSGFVQAVNLVGGLDINVDRSFDDYQYPIDGKEDDTCGHSQQEVEQLATSSSQLQAFPCRYKHIHFNSGPQHMDGETSLEYVRSRHAEGPEGSDFARSRREEKVISAFKSKLLSLGILLNPTKIVDLYNTLKGSIDTDISQNEFADFYQLSQKLKNGSIHSFVIDAGDQTQNRPGLLYTPTTNLAGYNYAWVLIPRIGNGDYSEIQEFTACTLLKNNCPVSATPSY